MADKNSQFGITGKLCGMLFVAVLFVLGGCNTIIPPCSGDSCNEETEPNGTFAQANKASLAADDTAVLAGTIDGHNDVDIFDLGIMTAGDVVEVTARRTSGNLQPSLAFFDVEGELVNENTITAVESPGASPSIEHSVREGVGSFYAAITHTFTHTTTGDYEITVNIQRGKAPLAPKKQVIYLHFDGGIVNDPILGELVANVFSGEAIDPVYAGQTDTIKASIIQTFIDNYRNFNVEILDSDHDELPADVEFSQVYLGGDNSEIFGVAYSVDLYNQDQGDSAIIFTEAFTPSEFTVTPTAAELGVAIGNVAAHEMGHLLGLNHVDDATALMDAVSPTDVLLGDQEFKAAPLSENIFPIGYQDAADLLLVILGPAVESAKATMRYLGLLDQLADAEESGELTRTRAKQVPFRASIHHKCLNCALREGRAGRGPFAHLADSAE